MGGALPTNKVYTEASLFEPQSLLREARRQKQLPRQAVPDVCVLEPDGDIVVGAIGPGEQIAATKGASP